MTLLVLVGIALLVAATAWLFASESVLQVGGGLGILGLVLLFWSAIRERDAASFLLFLYSGLLLGIWTYVGYGSLRVPIYLDNYSEYDVQLLVDGDPWISIDRNESLKKDLRTGRHRLDILSLPDQEALRAFDVVIENRKGYVLNVLGAMTYYRGTVQYGSVLALPPEREPEQRITQEWFEPKAYYVFQDPPESIEVPSRSGIEQRTYLRRAGSKRP